VRTYVRSRIGPWCLTFKSLLDAARQVLAKSQLYEYTHLLTSCTENFLSPPHFYRAEPNRVKFCAGATILGDYFRWETDLSYLPRRPHSQSTYLGSMVDRCAMYYVV